LKNDTQFICLIKGTVLGRALLGCWYLLHT